MDRDQIAALLNAQQELTEKIATIMKNLRKLATDKRNYANFAPSIEALKKAYKGLAANNERLSAVENLNEEYRQRIDETMAEYELSRIWINRFLQPNEKMGTLEQTLAELDVQPTPSGIEQKTAEREKKGAIPKEIRTVVEPQEQVNPLTIKKPEDPIPEKAKGIEDWADSVLLEEMKRREMFKQSQQELIERRSRSEIRAEEEAVSMPESVMGKLAEAIEKLADRSPDQNRSARYNFRQPELAVRAFAGNYKEWKPFKISIEAQFANARFSDAEKFSFLRSKLEGAALAEIEDMDFHGENYVTAMETLEARFSNPNRVIIDCITKFVLERENPPRDPSTFLKMIRVVRATVNNIRTLGPEENTFETAFVVAITQNMFSPMTRDRWNDYFSQLGEEESHGKRFPSVKEILGFMEKEYTWTLDRKMRETPTGGSNQKKKGEGAGATAFVTTQQPSTKKKQCFSCSAPHSVLDCPGFLAAKNRIEFLIKSLVCIRCAKHKYIRGEACRIAERLKCEICQGKHITLLCPSQNNQAAETQAMFCGGSSSLLPTARASAKSEAGMKCNVRMLVDGCAQLNFVTENLTRKLRLKREKGEIKVIGLNSIGTQAKGKVSFDVISYLAPFRKVHIEAYVVPQIASKLPNLPSSVDWQSLGLDLAEKISDTAEPVDVLLGSGVGVEIIGKINIKHEGFLLQPSEFGYLVSGHGEGENQQRRPVSAFVTAVEFDRDFQDACYKTSFTDDDDAIVNPDILDAVNKVKKVEEELMQAFPVEDDKSGKEKGDGELDKEEERKLCMEMSKDTIKLHESGRVLHPYPFNSEKKSLLGSTLRLAAFFFVLQERKWLCNEKLYQGVKDFFQEYIELGHMKPVPRSEWRKAAFYLPYHTILRATALTTKLRVVFQGNAKSTSGLSLNDTLMTTPNLLNAVFDILLRARLFKIMLSADVVKMFRCVLVPEDDYKYQRILFRFSNQDPLQEYELTTVTYGLEASSFMATRAIHFLAENYAPTEDTERVLKDHFYVDDLLTGQWSIEAAKDLVSNVRKALEVGGMVLSKWQSNEDAALQDVPKSHLLTSYTSDESTKLLGMRFNRSEDTLAVEIKKDAGESIKYTKRGLLSFVASLFDPMGLLAPVTVLLRIWLQSLWLMQMKWDDEVSQEMKEKFAKAINQISSIKQVSFPRWIGFFPSSSIELVGFSDASFAAYGCVIYGRIKGSDGFEINLLTAKAKVAPIKTQRQVDRKEFTIPKLELQAFVLLITVIREVKRVFGEAAHIAALYTDSHCTLDWIRNNRSTLKFVKTRVALIRGEVSPSRVHHTPGKGNPADSVSRGELPNVFVNNEIYLKGPSWLKNETLPETPFETPSEQACDVEQKEVLVFVTQEEEKETFIDRFISLKLIFNVIARILRWKNGLRGALRASEISEAKLRLIRHEQQKWFAKEISLFMAGKFLPKKHTLLPLTPFFDRVSELLRVGGRISKAVVTFDQRHPILLKKGKLARLLIWQTHLEFGHAGHLLCHRVLVQSYWIIGGMQEIKRTLRNCTTCLRWKRIVVHPAMGQLPESRVNFSLPFTHVGTDCCGPFNVRISSTRYDRTIKCYVVIFICMFTRAVHLETLSEMSTAALMAAIERFTARRGWFKNLYCDRGLNYVGAGNIMKDIWEKITTEIKETLALKEVTVTHNPSYAPWSGGLWERVVSVLKSAAYKMANIDTLTLEQFNTLITKIEGFINSRPLYPDFTAPGEAALTPFKLITNRDFKLLPFQAYNLNETDLPKYFKAIQKLVNELWVEYQTLYLHALQKKTKWVEVARNLKIDDIVLLKEISKFPGHWKMARITDIHPDSKGVVRNVTVKTATTNGLFRSVRGVVPIVESTPEKADAMPTRRSPRTRQTSAAVTALMLLLTGSAIMPTASAGAIKKVTEGIHAVSFGQVSMISSTFKITIITDLNVTQDESYFQKEAKQFREICDENKKAHPEFEQINRVCENQANRIHQHAASSISQLKTFFNKRSKRSSYAVLAPVATTVGRNVGKAIFKYVLKRPDVLMTTGGMIFQGIQIHNLQKKQEELQAKTKSLSNSLVRVVGIAEETEIDLEKSEQAITFETAKTNLQDVASSAIDVFEAMMQKYQDLQDLRPMDQIEERVKFVASEKEKLPSEDSVFSFMKPKYTVNEDGALAIQYVVPLQFKKSFEKISVVSAPAPGKIISTFDENFSIVRNIIVSTEDALFVELKDARQRGDLWEAPEEKFKSLESECWHSSVNVSTNFSIFNQNNCSKIQLPHVFTHALALHVQSIFVISSADELDKLHQVCPEPTAELETKTPAVIVDLNQCPKVLLHVNHNYLESDRLQEIFNILDIKIKPSRLDQIRSLKEKLSNELATQDESVWTNKEHFWVISAVGAASLMIIAIAIARKSKTRKSKEWSEKYLPAEPKIQTNNIELKVIREWATHQIGPI